MNATGCFMLTVLLSVPLFGKEPGAGVPELEPSEQQAVQGLSKADREIYLQQRPLAAVRHVFKVSGYSPDEVTATLVAVQRPVLDKPDGWRLVLLGDRSLLVFHVSDVGKVTRLLRSDLRELSKQVKAAEPSVGGDGKAAPQLQQDVNKTKTEERKERP